MGPKKRKGGSPSKSEPGGRGANNILLRSALKKARSERNTSIASDLTRSMRSGSIVDITNIPHRSNLSTLSSSSLDGTAKKRGKALAAFKQFQETVTPRTAMAEFMEAHHSSVQTPAIFFPSKRPDSLSGSGMGSYVQDRCSSTATRINASSVISDISDNVSVTEEDISTLSSDVSTGSEIRSRRGRREKRTGGVTLEDVDPDRDITRPTNRSRNNTQDVSNYPLSDESVNETMEIKVKRGRRKKKEYVADDFDFSIAYPGSQEEGVPASNTHSNTALGRTMGDSVYQVDRSLDITDEVVEKLKGRKEKLERRKTRHQQEVNAGDFSGLDTPPQKKDVVGAVLPTDVCVEDFEVEGDKTLVAEEDENIENAAEVQESQNVMDVVSSKLGTTHGATLGDISQEEETPVVTRRKRTRMGEYAQHLGKEFNFTEIETPEVSIVGTDEYVNPFLGKDASIVNSDTVESLTKETNDSIATPARKVGRSGRGKKVGVADFTGISLVQSSVQPTTGQTSSSTNFTLAETVGEEETPVRRGGRSKKEVVVDVGDFTGISLVNKTRNETVQAAAQPTPGQTLSSTNYTMGLTVSEEETPVKRTRGASKKKMMVDAGDFTDISINQLEDGQEKREEEQETMVAEEEVEQVAASHTLTGGQTLLGLTAVQEEDTPAQVRRADRKKMTVDAAEFTDISLQIVEEADDSCNKTVTTAAAGEEKVASLTHMGHTELGFTVTEETPVRSTRAVKRKVQVYVADFQDISVQNDDTAKSVVRGDNFAIDMSENNTKKKEDNYVETVKEDEGNSSHDSIRASRRQSDIRSSSSTLPFSPLVNTPSPSSRTLTNQIKRKSITGRKEEDIESGQLSNNDTPAISNPWEDDTTDVAPNLPTPVDQVTVTSAVEPLDTGGKEAISASSGTSASGLHISSVERDLPSKKSNLLSPGTVEVSSLSDNTSLGSISLHTTMPVKRGRVRPQVGVDMDEFDISLPSDLVEAAPEEHDEEDTQPLSQEEKDVLFSETKARRAARKSEVLGHLVRAPNLSNIVETSEVPSRPSSGLRTSSEVVGSRSSLEMVSRRSSSEVKSSRKSSGVITSIVEEGEKEVESENDDANCAPAEKEIKIVSSLDPDSEDMTDGVSLKPRKQTSRRSLYQAGLPEQPIDSSMLCDQTRVFRPEVESTRVGNMTGLTDLSPVQEATITREGARPGRDTSTPDISKTKSVGRAGQDKSGSLTLTEKKKTSEVASSQSTPHEVSNQPSDTSVQSAPPSRAEKLSAAAITNSPTRRSLSYLPPVPSKLALQPPDPGALSQTQPSHSSAPHPQQEGRLSKTLVNKSIMSVTSGTQYETPEQVREARRSGRRSNLRMSLYTTRLNMDDIAEGGTQTTPTLEITTAQPTQPPPKVLALLSETGCQVTPGLGAPVLQQTMVGQDRNETPRTHLVGEEDSINQVQVTRTEDMTSQTQENSVSVSTSPSLPQSLEVLNTYSDQYGKTQPNDTVKDVGANESISEEYVNRNATSGRVTERIIELTEGEVRKRRVEHAKVRVEIKDLKDKIDEAVLKKEFLVAENYQLNIAKLHEKQLELEEEIQSGRVKITSAIDRLDTSAEVSNVITDNVNVDSELETIPAGNGDDCVSGSDSVDSDIVDIVKDISTNIVDENSPDLEWAFPQYNKDKSQELVNSFAEVDIEQEEDVSDHDSSGQVELNITGRKNPSPVLERRPEVEVESDDDDFHDGQDELESEDEQNIEAEAKNSDMDSPPPIPPAFSPDTSGPVVRPVPVLPAQERVLPNAKERKEMRQATLARYLGIQDVTAKQGLDTLLTPQLPKKKITTPPKPKPVKPKPKTTFPAKNIKFDFNRFSRFKLKKDAEEILTEASQDFMDLAMSRLSDLAKARGADKIHLCDIRKLMGECGFVKPVEEDPANRYLNSTLREVVREDLIRELIPCSVGDGTVYPPTDCWKEKGGKKTGKSSLKPGPSGSRPVVGSGSKTNISKPSGSSNSLGKASAGKKADKVKRFKVAEDLDTTEPKRPRLETKNGGKGKKNRN